MKSYELTDEEVMEATQVDMILDDGSLTGRIQVAHAAQKKLLEYLNSIYGTPAFMTESLMCIPISNWQSLLKDFGI